MKNFCFLACLEVAEKFVVVVVGWGAVVGWWWSRPSKGFSFSQAEQLKYGGGNHFPLSEYYYTFTTKLPIDLRPSFELEYVHCGLVELK